MVLLASNYDQSRFLNAADRASEKKLRIKEVTEEEMADKTTKLVVWFTNDKKGLVLNKTNNRTIRGAFGDDCAGWKDKIIVVYPTTVDMRGKMVPALRVRIPTPKQGGGNSQAAAPPPKLPKPPPPPKSVEADPELDEFGQSMSGASDTELDDEIAF
jgi:hypothetical protein